MISQNAIEQCQPIFCDTTNVQIFRKSDLSADQHYQIDAVILHCSNTRTSFEKLSLYIKRQRYFYTFMHHKKITKFNYKNTTTPLFIGKKQCQIIFWGRYEM
jgi:hypothetical protein